MSSLPSHLPHRLLTLSEWLTFLQVAIRERRKRNRPLVLIVQNAHFIHDVSSKVSACRDLSPTEKLSFHISYRMKMGTRCFTCCSSAPKLGVRDSGGSLVSWPKLGTQLTSCPLPTPDSTIRRLHHGLPDRQLLGL